MTRVKEERKGKQERWERGRVIRRVRTIFD